jgi:acetate kinase
VLLQGLGVELDQAANEAMVGGRQGAISSGKVQVLVVPTDEELSIAQQTLAVVRGMGREE